MQYEANFVPWCKKEPGEEELVPECASLYQSKNSLKQKRVFFQNSSLGFQTINTERKLNNTLAINSVAKREV